MGDDNTMVEVTMPKGMIVFLTELLMAAHAAAVETGCKLAEERCLYAGAVLGRHIYADIMEMMAEDEEVDSISGKTRAQLHAEASKLN